MSYLPPDDGVVPPSDPSARSATGFEAKAVTPQQWLVAGGAVLFFVSLLLPWVSVSVADDQTFGGLSDSASGISQGSLMLALILLVAAAAVLLLPMFGVEIPQLPVPRSLIVLGLTALALLITLVKVIDVMTSGGDVEGFLEVSTGFGAYLGLLSALAATAGATLLFLAQRTTTQPAV